MTHLTQDCRYCGARIRMHLTAKGRYTPVEAATLCFETEADRPRSGRYYDDAGNCLPPMSLQWGLSYSISHWDHCKGADKARNR